MIEQRKHELSGRQMAILTFIHEYQISRGFVPSIREIAEAIGTTSTSAVTYQINRLVGLGYISKVGEVARGMILLAPAYEAIGTEAPEDTNLSMMRAELLALRVENQRIRQLYEERVKKLEGERNQLSQTLSILKYRAIKQLEGVFEEERVS
ncbi:MAG: hypothetical protein D6698_07145 [Gammaproteobacteria bacterium]|nr:MAG: hypothetical protein D6698_07145 [Gammaproteobacteria bacterium]